MECLHVNVMKFYVIEINFPFKFRGQCIKEGLNDCNFWKILDGKIHLKKSRKYYTQVASQMANRYKVRLFHCLDIKGYVF